MTSYHQPVKAVSLSGVLSLKSNVGEAWVGGFSLLQGRALYQFSDESCENIVDYIVLEQDTVVEKMKSNEPFQKFAFQVSSGGKTLLFQGSTPVDVDLWVRYIRHNLRTRLATAIGAAGPGANPTALSSTKEEFIISALLRKVGKLEGDLRVQKYELLQKEAKLMRLTLSTSSSGHFDTSNSEADVSPKAAAGEQSAASGSESKKHKAQRKKRASKRAASSGDILCMQHQLKMLGKSLGGGGAGNGIQLLNRHCSPLSSYISAAAGVPGPTSGLAAEGVEPPINSRSVAALEVLLRQQKSLYVELSQELAKERLRRTKAESRLRKLAAGRGEQDLLSSSVQKDFSSPLPCSRPASKSLSPCETHPSSAPASSRIRTLNFSALPRATAVGAVNSARSGSERLSSQRSSSPFSGTHSSPEEVIRIMGQPAVISRIPRAVRHP